MTDVRDDAGRGRDSWLEPGQDLDDLLTRWGSEQSGPWSRPRTRSGGRHAAPDPTTSRDDLSALGPPRGVPSDHGASSRGPAERAPSRPVHRPEHPSRSAGTAASDWTPRSGRRRLSRRLSGRSGRIRGRQVPATSRRGRRSGARTPATGTRTSATGTSRRRCRRPGRPVPMLRRTACTPRRRSPTCPDRPTAPRRRSRCRNHRARGHRRVRRLAQRRHRARRVRSRCGARCVRDRCRRVRPGQRGRAPGAHPGPVRPAHPRPLPRAPRTTPVRPRVRLRVRGRLRRRRPGPAPPHRVRPEPEPPPALAAHPRLVGAFLGILLLAGGGFGPYQYKKLSGNIHRVDALAPATPPSGTPPSSWTRRTTCSSARTPGPGRTARTRTTPARSAASARTPRSSRTSRPTGRRRS